jgi:Domain of unknown function (DUF1877)
MPVSMMLVMVALSEHNLQRVWSDPGLASRAISTDFPDDRPGGELDLTPGEGEVGELDKAWHGIHYLLTQTAWEEAPPLGALVGGHQLPDDQVEWGFGPPWILAASETAAFADALAALSNDELVARFDPADMMEKKIYPQIWDRDPEDDDTLGYLMEYLAVLRDFVRTTAERRFGLLIAIT